MRPCSSFFFTTSSGELKLQLSVTGTTLPCFIHFCSSSSTTTFSD